MQGSVVWATVISLLLGCVIGVAGMGAVLLPVQYKLQQEQLGARQLQEEMEAQRGMDAQEYDKVVQERRKAERQTVLLLEQNRKLELQYADAVRRVADLEQKLQQKKP